MWLHHSPSWCSCPWGNQNSRVEVVKSVMERAQRSLGHVCSVKACFFSLSLSLSSSLLLLSGARDLQQNRPGNEATDCFDSI